jgi:hypothetical protein
MKYKKRYCEILIQAFFQAPLLTSSPFLYPSFLPLSLPPFLPIFFSFHFRESFLFVALFPSWDHIGFFLAIFSISREELTYPSQHSKANRKKCVCYINTDEKQKKPKKH